MARCAGCGQYVSVADPSKTWDHWCHRCARVEDYYGALGNVRVGCENTVTDRDGIEDACGKPVFGLRADPESGCYYAVCRKHYRPPFQACIFTEDDHCDIHGGTRYFEFECCNLAVA